MATTQRTAANTGAVTIDTRGSPEEQRVDGGLVLGTECRNAAPRASISTATELSRRHCATGDWCTDRQAATMRTRSTREWIERRVRRRSGEGPVGYRVAGRSRAQHNEEPTTPPTWPRWSRSTRLRHEAREHVSATRLYVVDESSIADAGRPRRVEHHAEEGELDDDKCHEKKLTGNPRCENHSTVVREDDAAQVRRSSTTAMARRTKSIDDLQTLAGGRSRAP